MFVGSHINSTERRAYKAFENICRKFLGSEKTENYSEIVQELISLQTQFLNVIHSP
jgi:hypothetical protein